MHTPLEVCCAVCAAMPGEGRPGARGLPKHRRDSDDGEGGEEVAVTGRAGAEEPLSVTYSFDSYTAVNCTSGSKRGHFSHSTHWS